MPSTTNPILIALKYHQAGQLQKAEAAYRQILLGNPNHPDALNLLGTIAIQTGKYTIATELINKAIVNSPENPLFYNNLGVALKSHRKLEDACQAYKKAIHFKPDYAEAWNNLGVAQKELNRDETAVDCYKQALIHQPDYIEALVNLGNALILLGKYDTAIEKFRQALDLNPGFYEAWKNLGNAMRALGKLESAIDSYRQALRYKPEYAEVHYLLSCTKRYTEYDDDIQAMEELFENKSVTDKQRMQLCFGLGKAFEEIKQYDKAFSFLSEGNKIKRNSYEYDVLEDKALFTRIMDVFDRDFFDEHAYYNSSKDSPIFIVGMPRSGTTLVEQILTSHHKVYGAGELDDLKHVLLTTNPKLTPDTFPEGVINLNRDDTARFADKYIGNLNQYNIDGKDYVSNKMTTNFLYIGMIRMLFPMAKVIHCKRDPRDTCLSCFKNNFEGYLPFTYNLTELGQYFCIYQKLMIHWHNVLPGFIFDIKYEDLITNQETETRKMIDYCGLCWDEKCLSFHKSDRIVKTSSFSQVRRPINRNSIHIWEQYKKQLEPLLSALPR
ncbi:MAG: tetratricopeptide repeat protein [Candidatus Brocadiaceae bacterium]|nr:tetratricopeptide repeat protein [Candidatus Brocadiaceae bacterium]